jgi:hypothetical protein
MYLVHSREVDHHSLFTHLVMWTGVITTDFSFSAGDNGTHGGAFTHQLYSIVEIAILPVTCVRAASHCHSSPPPARPTAMPSNFFTLSTTCPARQPSTRSHSVHQQVTYIHTTSARLDPRSGPLQSGAPGITVLVVLGPHVAFSVAIAWRTGYPQ